MDPSRVAARRFEEDISNAGVASQGNQAPPQEKVALGVKATINPSVMMDEEIRVTFLNMTQVINTQAQVVTIEAQTMISQVDREVAPLVHQNANTMSSRLWDFTRINHPLFFVYKVNKYPQDFLDEV